MAAQLHPGGSGLMLAVTGSSHPLAEEAQALAERLQQLALAAAAASVPPADAGSRTWVQERHCGQSSDLQWINIPGLEAAEHELVLEEAALERLREESLSWQRRRTQPFHASAAQASVAAQLEAEAQAQLRLGEAQEALARWHADEDRACKVVSDEAVLQKELAEASARLQSANMEATAAASSDAAAPKASCASSAQAAEARTAMEQSHAKVARLEDEKSRLQDELDSLRFQVKDMKKSQHQITQELDAQMRKLEKQRTKLEHEESSRQKEHQAEEEASAENAQENANQLRKLQDLNAQVSGKVREYNEERRRREEAAEQMCAEVAQLVPFNKSESAQVREEQRQSQALTEAEDDYRIEARQLQNRMALLRHQVTQLEHTAAQTGLQLSEAEDVHRRASEEEAAATRRCEILDWKMQVAKTHLSTNANSVVGARSGGASARVATARTSLRSSRGSDSAQSRAEDSACDETATREPDVSAD
eukprot:TRINITY_DN41132_c0_g1_i1.p1 TRINITY_DN41132_c0_g1~~TRINITY_DN41132_c0_g1_i1.p1  ORF type:complete len:480 (+),score=145.56 TRINITY_DN41132_c0_g1_i1:83-1522(+)